MLLGIAAEEDKTNGAEMIDGDGDCFVFQRQR